ncbi:MAG: cytochrome c [Flavobacteriaceae bacterium]|nr:cytochrome c [Flavobacteriaceae bacterium]
MSRLIIIFLFPAFVFSQDIRQSESYANGQLVYEDFCMLCHMANGQGVPKAFPPLANSDYLKDIKATVNSIKYGLNGPIVVNGVKYNSVMAPMGLDDQEVADVTNFILNTWGNKYDKLITKQMVEKLTTKQ